MKFSPIQFLNQEPQQRIKLPHQSEHKSPGDPRRRKSTEIERNHRCSCGRAYGSDTLQNHRKIKGCKIYSRLPAKDKPTGREDSQDIPPTSSTDGPTEEVQIDLTKDPVTVKKEQDDEGTKAEVSSPTGFVCMYSMYFPHGCPEELELDERT